MERSLKRETSTLRKLNILELGDLSHHMMIQVFLALMNRLKTGTY